MTDLDTMDMGVPMRDRYERFCGHFVESRSPLVAFRMAFVVDATKTKEWMIERANKLLNEPYIKERIHQMRDAAWGQTVQAVKEIMEDWRDIALADPNEIVAHVRVNCRFCRGNDHRYQWGTELEYAQAFDMAIKLQQPMPDCSGGFGFNGTLDPVMTCPSCYGQGIGEVVIADTRKLSGRARKLYAGAKQTSKGIEVQLHDQHKAREALAKILGAFDDGVPIDPQKRSGATIDGNMTPQDAMKTYMQLVAG